MCLSDSMVNAPRGLWAISWRVCVAVACLFHLCLLQCLRAWTAFRERDSIAIAFLDSRAAWVLKQVGRGGACGLVASVSITWSSDTWFKSKESDSVPSESAKSCKRVPDPPRALKEPRAWALVSYQPPQM